MDQFVTDNYDVDQIILAVHSFGARKAVHYLYRAQNPKVAGLALLSASEYKTSKDHLVRIDRPFQLDKNDEIYVLEVNGQVSFHPQGESGCLSGFPSRTRCAE